MASLSRAGFDSWIDNDLIVKENGLLGQSLGSINSGKDFLKRISNLPCFMTEKDRVPFLQGLYKDLNESDRDSFLRVLDVFRKRFESNKNQYQSQLLQTTKGPYDSFNLEGDLTGNIAIMELVSKINKILEFLDPQSEIKKEEILPGISVPITSYVTPPVSKKKLVSVPVINRKKATLDLITEKSEVKKIEETPSDHVPKKPEKTVLDIMSSDKKEVSKKKKREKPAVFKESERSWKSKDRPQLNTVSEKTFSVPVVDSGLSMAEHRVAQAHQEKKKAAQVRDTPVLEIQSEDIIEKLKRVNIGQNREDKIQLIAYLDSKKEISVSHQDIACEVGFSMERRAFVIGVLLAWVNQINNAWEAVYGIPLIHRENNTYAIVNFVALEKVRKEEDERAARQESMKGYPELLTVAGVVRGSDQYHFLRELALAYKENGSMSYADIEEGNLSDFLKKLSRLIGPFNKAVQGLHFDKLVQRLPQKKKICFAVPTKFDGKVSVNRFDAFIEYLCLDENNVECSANENVVGGGNKTKRDITRRSSGYQKKEKPIGLDLDASLLKDEQKELLAVAETIVWSPSEKRLLSDFLKYSGRVWTKDEVCTRANINPVSFPSVMTSVKKKLKEAGYEGSLPGGKRGRNGGYSFGCDILEVNSNEGSTDIENNSGSEKKKSTYKKKKKKFGLDSDSLDRSSLGEEEGVFFDAIQGIKLTQILQKLIVFLLKNSGSVFSSLSIEKHLDIKSNTVSSTIYRFDKQLDAIGYEGGRIERSRGEGGGFYFGPPLLTPLNLNQERFLREKINEVSSHAATLMASVYACFADPENYYEANEVSSVGGEPVINAVNKVCRELFGNDCIWVDGGWFYIYNWEKNPQEENEEEERKELENAPISQEENVPKDISVQQKKPVIKKEEQIVPTASVTREKKTIFVAPEVKKEDPNQALWDDLAENLEEYTLDQNSMRRLKESILEGGRLLALQIKKGEHIRPVMVSFERSAHGKSYSHYKEVFYFSNGIIEKKMLLEEINDSLKRNKHPLKIELGSDESKGELKVSLVPHK